MLATSNGGEVVPDLFTPVPDHRHGSVARWPSELWDGASGDGSHSALYLRRRNQRSERSWQNPIQLYPIRIPMIPQSPTPAVKTQKGFGRLRFLSPRWCCISHSTRAHAINNRNHQIRRTCLKQQTPPRNDCASYKIPAATRQD